MPTSSGMSELHLYTHIKQRCTRTQNIFKHACTSLISADPSQLPPTTIHRYSVDFHPTEPILATASADHTVRIWSAKSKRVVHSL